MIVMELLNTIFLIIGTCLTLLGLASLFFPNLTRWINAPGGPRLKSIICLIIGVIFVIFSLLVEMPLPTD